MHISSKFKHHWHLNLSKVCISPSFLGFVYASWSKWNFPFLLNWCSWMTTFRNFKTYLPSALKHLSIVISKFFGKTKCYCNISVGLINRTTKNTGWPRPLRFENFCNCPIRIEIITGSHIFILFLPRVVTLCLHFTPRYRSR
jgi:hypothetical protein